jgi:hypothetical protein
VTGIDNTIWTAYGVVDNYYDPRSKTSLDSLHRRWEEAEKLALWDPIAHNLLTYGPMKSENPIIWNAREYFVAALRTRFREENEHWDDIVKAMEKADAERGYVIPHQD